MIKERSVGLTELLVVILLVGLPFVSASAQERGHGLEVLFEHHRGVSRPLRDIEPKPRREGPPREIFLGKPHLEAGAPQQTDPVAHRGTEGSPPPPPPPPPSSLATTAGLNILGVGTGFTGPQGTFIVDAAPPDQNGAVGATQYVQWVNESFAVFNKATGVVLYGPAAGNTLWTGFGGGCETNNDGDPIVAYDKAADRWVMTQFSVFTTPYLQCVAVSQTSDATGAWYLYAFQMTDFPDYAKLGVWHDAYYMSFNMFGPIFFTGAKVCALERSKMLNGLLATQQCLQLSTSFASLLPSDLDGSTAPPAGSPNYLLNLGTNSLNLWKFHVDWINPLNTTLTGPINIPVVAFSKACSGGGVCIPQGGTTQKLDSVGDRLMHRLAYRNFGTHESLVVNHSVAAGGRRSSSVGVRWYELRNPGGTPTVFQQATYAPDSNYRWMGSIAMDKMGDIAVGYSVSSSTINPAIRYTGREPADALGTMRTEITIFQGTGSKLPKLSRWGDYSGMSIDPVDDCTFFYTNEYLTANGTFNWSTRIASFKFPSCS